MHHVSENTSVTIDRWRTTLHGTRQILSNISREFTWQLSIWNMKWKGTPHSQFLESDQVNRGNDKWLCADHKEIPTVMHMIKFTSFEVVLGLWATRATSCYLTSCRVSRSMPPSTTWYQTGWSRPGSRGWPCIICSHPHDPYDPYDPG